MSTSEPLLIKSRVRDYEVFFSSKWDGALPGPAPDAFYLVDRVVYELYGARLRTQIEERQLVLIEANEFQKTLEHSTVLIKDLITRGIRRNHRLVAIGGGITQDLTAFIASIVFRGVTWSFVPTTLLAQADSCVGSKSSLNLGPYKNVLGTFYPPTQVWIDVDFLKTLPAEAIRSGIGEIMHFYLVDGNERIFTLADQYESLFLDRAQLLSHIRLSLSIKKKIVEVDEFDEHVRNLFNYGHTFGHAIETVTNYAVNHGQAVTMGMDIANFLSVRQGYLSVDQFKILHQLLRKNMPSMVLAGDQLDAYLAALAKDKKNVNSNLTCILTKGPGVMQKVQIPLDAKLKALLEEYFHSFASAAAL